MTKAEKRLQKQWFEQPRSRLSKQDIYRVFILNKNAVHTFAAPYYLRNKGKLDYDDLYQVGCMGLLRAIHDYQVNHDSRASFITYAYHWIMEAILMYLKVNKGLVYVPIKQ